MGILRENAFHPGLAASLRGTHQERVNRTFSRKWPKDFLFITLSQEDTDRWTPSLKPRGTQRKTREEKPSIGRLVSDTVQKTEKTTQSGLEWEAGGRWA